MHNSIVFTDAAARKVNQLISEEGNLDLKLRVYIVGGGCSGFQYGFAFDDKQNDDDFVIKKSCSILPKPCGQTGENTLTTITSLVIIDALSMNYLQGAEIDYMEGLSGAHFVVRNPKAKTTCGCGSSFSI